MLGCFSTEPSCGTSSPQSSLIMVDLPAPLGPTTATLETGGQGHPLNAAEIAEKFRKTEKLSESGSKQERKENVAIETDGPGKGNKYGHSTQRQACALFLKNEELGNKNWGDTRQKTQKTQKELYHAEERLCD